MLTQSFGGFFFGQLVFFGFFFWWVGDPEI